MSLFFVKYVVIMRSASCKPYFHNNICTQYNLEFYRIQDLILMDHQRTYNQNDKMVYPGA